MALYFDHVVVNVRNLSKAIHDFEKAGFTVVPGGKHGGGLSENALIFFQDDGFIELFSLRSNLKTRLLKLLGKFKFLKSYQYSKKWGLAYRFYSRALELPEGITDLCFLSDDYSSECKRIHNEGLFLTKPLKASRKKPDGKRTSWEMSTPFINELPFLRSAYRPPAEIDVKHCQHKNGAVGINRVTVVALDFKDMVSKYEIFLNKKPNQSSKNKGQKAVFILKNTLVEILKSSDHKELQEKLRGKGLGMYGLHFKGENDKTDIPEITERYGMVIGKK